MSSPGFAPERIQQVGPEKYVVSHGDDRGLFVTFEMKPIFQEFKSKETGKQVWQDVPHITITQPGAKSEVVRPVKLDSDNGVPSDPERFPRQWAAFQNQHEQAQSGMPLEEVAWLPKSRILEFKSQKIHTVEQLAALSDAAMFGMDTRSLRDKAIAFLNKADEGAVVAKLTAENESLRTDVEMLKAQFAELAGHPADLTPTPPKRGPGRPRAVKDETNASS